MTHAAAPLLSSLPATPPAGSPLTVVAAPQTPVAATISASEMSRLTGVERERLRTWERRHGFPIPVRCANNVRRYLAADVRRVSAIAGRSAQGVPLAQAVAEVLAEPEFPAASVSPGAALEELPSPAIAVRGPRPMEVVWRNGAADAAPGAPMVGDDLALDPERIGPAALEVLRRMMAGELTGPQCFEARDWTTPEPHVTTVTAWLLAAPGGVPTAVLAKLPQEPAEVAPLRPAEGGSSVTPWAQATAAGREALQRSRGLAGLQQALAAAVASLGATDASLALVRGAELRVARSVRGQVPPTTVELSGCEELRSTIHGTEVEWLGLRSGAALRVDPRARTLAVPITVGDLTVGLALFVLRDERELCHVSRELLCGFGAMLGAALERERGLRRAAGAV